MIELAVLIAVALVIGFLIGIKVGYLLGYRGATRKSQPGFPVRPSEEESEWVSI